MKRRWVIPGFDKVWVGPLGVVAITALLTVTLIKAAWPDPLACGLFATVVLTATLTLPPRFHEWRLTGSYQAVRPSIRLELQGGKKAGRLS